MYLYTIYISTVFDIIDLPKMEKGFFIYQFYFIFVTFSWYFKHFPLYICMWWVFGIRNLLTFIFVTNWTTYQHEIILLSQAYCLEFSYISIVTPLFGGGGVVICLIFLYLFLYKFITFNKLSLNFKNLFWNLCILIGKVNPFIDITILILLLIYFNYPL